jgi:hypothetical protein
MEEAAEQNKNNNNNNNNKDAFPTVRDPVTQIPGSTVSCRCAWTVCGRK